MKFAAGDVEIVFTTYLPIGYSLRRKTDNIVEIPNRNGVVYPVWQRSIQSNYVSNRFLEQMQVGHFHVDHDSDIVVSEVKNSSNQHVNLIPFLWSDSFHLERSGISHRSIAPIEATVFQNGYVALVMRVTNAKPIDAKTVLRLIKHPEFVLQDVKDINEGIRNRNGKPITGFADPGLIAGELIRVLYCQLERLEEKVQGAVACLDIESLSESDGKWHDIGEVDIDRKQSGKRWTRPYVGVHFKRPIFEADDVGKPEEIIARFVIASGRSTPPFFEEFERPLEHLNSEGRNVYGSGGSIVYVAKRGWAVYNSGHQNALSFAFGVVEITHLTLMAIETASRSRRRFLQFINRNGNSIFQELNARVKNMVDLKARRTINLFKMRRAMKEFERAVSQSTSFLVHMRLISPCDDVSSHFELHLLTHTGRAAAKRYKDLMKFRDLDEGCRAAIENYSEFLKTSSDYLNLQTFKVSISTLYVAVAGVLVAVLFQLTSVHL